ncbi:MAG: efflux transporter periplasmic adaptor subunit [Flavobacteriaceae bacterium]|nr:efflux transporter periplasmic adaptor subunit [Flavobacteriaceae bacterium]|tara:strand:+ start:98120 stop:99226 length:1107 start_codon:yes stop_codon:yes gene_type:complete
MKKIIILLTALSLSYCSKKEAVVQPSEKNTSNELVITKEKFKNEQMLLISPKTQMMHSGLRANGVIDVPPNFKANVSSFYGGVIQQIPFIEGSKISKGAFVASISNPEFINIQKGYLQSLADFNFSEDQHERKSRLYQEKVISKKEFAESEKGYKEALANYGSFKQQLAILNIKPETVEKGEFTSVVNLYAPISGNISEVFVKKGSYVEPSSPLLEIINTDHIHLELTIFEKDALKVKKDQPIIFKIPEASTTAFSAKVSLVATAVSTDRTIKVHGHLDDDNHRFMAGMFVDAQIITDQNNALVLPKSAILTDGEEHYVLALRKENNEAYHFVKQPISIGQQKDNMCEIMGLTNPSQLKVLANSSFTF